MGAGWFRRVLRYEQRPERGGPPGWRPLAGALIATGLLVGCTGSKTVTSEGSSITQLSVATDQQSTNSGANVPGSTSATPATPVTSPPRSTAVRIMALGDSLTAGDDPSNPAKAQSYRGYLESSLQAAGYKVDFVGSMKQPAIGGNDPDHEGHGGFSIGPDNAKLCAKDQTCPPANLDSGLAGWLKEADPDVVVLLAGVNDLFDEDAGVYRPTVPEQADDKLKALVARIRALQPDARIVVGSYPPISFLITGSDEKVFADLNAAAKSAGSGTDKQVVYAPLREKLDGNWTDADVVSTSDQVHPRDTGAKKIAAVFYEAMVPVLDALGR